MKTNIKFGIFAYIAIILVLSTVSLAEIVLVSPQDSVMTNKDNNALGFTFRYSDANGTSAACDLLIDSKISGSKAVVKSGEEVTLYSFNTFKEGLHYFEVRCGAKANKTGSDVRLFTYDITPPTITNFYLKDTVSCIAKDTVDTQVKVSIDVDESGNTGTCMALDKAGNFLVVDQNLKVILTSEEESVKPQETIEDVVEKVESANITGETEIETPENVAVELPKENEAAPVQANETPSEPPKKSGSVLKLNLNMAYVGIAILVLIIAAVLAFYMFRKSNEVVIVK